MTTLKPLDPQILRQTIKNTLIPLGLYSDNACELLLATCANESNFGEYREQVGGPAKGIYQQEPEDHDDIWKNYLIYHMDLNAKIHQLSGSCDANDLINNDIYSTAMARIHYMRAPGTLPANNDIEGIWNYYKQHYNTPQGAATHDEFIAKYNKFVMNANT
jgi:hypothetical protein